MTSADKRASSDSKVLIDVRGLARMLHLSHRTVWRLRDAGKLPAPVKLAGCVRWREAEISEWIAAGCPAVRPVGRVARGVVQ